MPKDKTEPAWRKKKSRVSREPPLPVPVAPLGTGLPSRQTWYCFTGCLKGSTVVIQHSGDLDFLYRMGFFGKGSLSRSEPNFQARRRKVNIPNRKKDNSDEESEAPSVHTIKLAVASKRSFLTHLQYKALAEEDEDRYNELLEQETMQRCSNEDDYEDFEDEDEEVEDEESYESSGSSPIKLASAANFHRDSGQSGSQSGSSSDLGSQSRSFLISLLSQVAQLSKESITTFIQVPETLQQLERKFQKARLQQVSQSENRNDVNCLSNPSPSKSISKSRSHDVIDLRDLDETDDVVVLNSDENSKDSERHIVGETEKEVEKTSKSWDDPNNEGDANFWGTDTPEGDETIQGHRSESSLSDPQPPSEPCKNSSSSLNAESVVSKEPESLRNGSMADKENIDKNSLDDKDSLNEKMVSDKTGDEKTDLGVPDDQQTHCHVSPLNKDSKDCPDPEKKSSDLSTRTEDRAHDPQPHVFSLNKDSNDCPNPEKKSLDISEKMEHDPLNSNGKDTLGETGDLVSVDSAIEGSLIYESNPKSSELQIGRKTMSSNPPPSAEDSNDSDDVICVEDGSAEPSKLHNYLSQSSFQAQGLPFPLISKMVRFMTNIAKEPRFVTAKVGFYSWTNILHFNYSGDATHLPTALEVFQEEETHQHIPRSDVRNIVYERVYPPIDSLLTDPDSKGVVIKQRLEGIPFLDVARSNILSSLSRRAHDSHSNNRQVPSSLHKPPMPHKQLHKKSSFLHQKEPSHHESSLPHRTLNFIEKEKEESSLLKPSHVTQYVNVFQTEKSDNTLESIGTNDHSDDNTAVEKDECLERIQKELNELKAFSLVSSQAASEKQETIEKNKRMLKLNDLVSKYMSEIGISLIKESVLLKLIVCGSEANDNISEDFVSTAKAKLSSEEYSFLLKRIDFVKSCLAPYTSSHSEVKETSDDVIMIDLSDEESNDKNKGDWLVGGSSSLPESLHLESQNDGENKLDGKNSKEDGVLDTTEKVKIAEGSIRSEAKEMVLEGMSNLPGRKRTRNDLLESEQGPGSKICKVDVLHSEDSKEEGDSSRILDTPQTVDKPHISSNHQKSDDTDSNFPEEKDNGDNQTNDVNSNSSFDTQRNLSAEEGDSSSKLSHTVSEPGRDIPDKESTSLNSNKEVKSNSNIYSSRDSDGKNVPDNIQKSIEEKINPSTSHATLEENQIYIESSDEEEERLSDVKVNKSGFLGCQPHPYSVSDDLNGNLFVIPNTSDEEQEEETTSSEGRFTWQPCVKKDPYPFSEQLNLLLEEAFFLTFGLGCLTVLDPEKNAMTITEMWQQFPTLKDNFVPHYIAYHYFRSKGWVPKSGLKFGCDFVLYREGPPFFHGSYSVVVVAVDEGTLTPMIGEEGGLDYAQRLNTWITLSGLNRVTEHVAKELMYCYVICPKNLTEEELKSPKCMSRFRVKEVVVSRWVSSKEREVKDKEEIP